MTMNWNTRDTGTAAITVTCADKNALLSDLRQRFVTGTGFSVATLNLDHTVKLAQDPAFRQAYAAHSHITADGNPVVWLSRLAGQPSVSLVPGSELVEPVAALAAELDVPVALLGGTQASLDKAAEALRNRIPGLRVVLCHAPPMGFDPDGPEAEEAIQALADSGARLVFLALGAPRQERFAARAQDRLPACGFLSIGAGLDFVSGAQRRAPLWVRRISAEWLWRMMGNPSRLAGRYLRCILILPALTGRALATRRAR